MSLTTCLKKVSISAEDKRAIQAMVRKLRAEGMKPDAAAREAVDRQIAAVRGLSDVQAREAEAPVVETVVEDFGEKLPPARRALAAKLGEELTEDAIGKMPLSQIWPATENEAIEEPFAAAVAHVLREAVPAKPRVAYKLKSWVSKVQMLREFAAQVLSGDVSRDTLLAEIGKVYALRHLGSKIKLLEKIDRADWKRIGDVAEAPNAIRYDDAGKSSPRPSVSVQIDGKSHWLEGSGDVLAHLEGIKAMLGKEAPETRMQFEIRQEQRGDRKVFINKKGDKEYRRLMEFATVDEARKAIKDRYAELVAAWEGVKARDNITERDLRSDVNRERQGQDYRQGRDVTPQEFADTFGFRGGEFGGWVSQGKGTQERQAMLNSAYDALRDLADILGVPPKAISLEGSLGIAFGSRGSGWASAHFEPSNLVINLTKTRGAGALAHEWFHALDNYFARKRGGEVPFQGDQAAYRRDNYITYKTAPMMVRKDGRGAPLTLERLEEWRKGSPDSAYLSPDQWIEDPKHKQGVRAEVEQRFDALVKALNASPMLKRAKKLDGSGADGYWSRVIELAARSFENYIQTKMLERGYHNDFLANVKAASEVGKSRERYPYLLPEEVAPIAQAFDDLFQTIDTREDEAGNVAMFSRSAPFVATSQDESGRTEYANAEAGITLAFPQVTERLEVIEAEGEEVVNYAIMPMEGFDSFGYVELLVKDGAPVSLLDIEINPDARQEGLGRKVIETLLAAHPDIDLNISNIIPTARGFWEKMGVPAQNVEGAYDGTLNWQTYAEAQDGDGAGGSSRASRAAGEGRDTGTARADRGPAGTGPTTQGLSRAEVAAISALPEATRNLLLGRTLTFERAQELAQAFGDKLGIRVVRNVAEMPADHREQVLNKAPDGKVRGVYFKDDDSIWLVSDQLHSEAELSFVALHEAFHRGLAKTIGADAKRLLKAMYLTNGALRKEADRQAKLHKIGLDEAIEEALADMAGEGKARDLRGWDKLVKMVRDWLSAVSEAIGLNGITWTDDMVADFVAGTARAGLDGAVVNQAAGASAGRAIDQTETPEFKRWFGDSKVVDAEGKPLVVYHGTTGDFGAFDKAKTGENWRQGEGAFFFTSRQRTASNYATRGGDGANVMPVYLSLENPALRTALDPIDFYDINIKPEREALEAQGYDGVIVKSADGGGDLYVAFRPEQIKSATGNNGSFDPANPDIRLSRAAAIRDQSLPMGYKVSDFIDSHGKLSFWHRSVGTMHNLAKRDALFRPVYDTANRFLGDVSYYATEAANLAPTLLPKLEGLRDIAKAPLSAEDTKAIAAPIFEGTLNWTRDETGKPVRADAVETAGVVWTDAELRERFKLNDKQIGLYREMRAAVDRSLADLTVSDMLRYGGSDVAAVREAALAAKDVSQAAEIMIQHLNDRAAAEPRRAKVLRDTADTIQQKADRAKDLMARGYAPLSRFGQYTLDVTDKDGERIYFGLFESQADANRFARKMQATHPGANFAQGTLSQEAYKLFAGVSPETLELFGDMLGLETSGDDAASQAFQTYIKLAKSNRSALKRLIHRQGIAGFSEDAGRVLAGFVYSNARQASKNLHFGELSQAVNQIAKDKGQGELLDAAVQLHQYITNPQEEAGKLRGLLFAQFLGGSLAAGLVNLTQSFSVTFPYLSQYGGVQKAALQMRRALKDAAKWETSKQGTGDAKLDAALKKAEEEGIVSPQEVHFLMAQAGGKGALRAGDGTKAGDAAAKASNFVSKLMLAWGRPFALAEQFNRRAAFIAAYRTAVDQKMADPAAFAEQTVVETQFSYTKANRPKWARGAIGATLFTFKTFSISYVELLTRMAKSGPEGKRAALVGLGMLFLMSGLQGLPGADDLDDLIDGALQRLGYNFSSKQAKREFLAGILGEDGAAFVMKGVSGLPGVPIDVSGRLGLGNLLPGTGLLTKKDDHSRDVAELLGPAGKLAEQALKAGDAMVQGESLRAVQAIAPVALANLIKGFEMASMGMYRDDRGRKVLDTDATDAVMKAIGFQPSDVSKVQQATWEVQKMVALNKLRESEIAAKWATGLFERDPEKVKEARDELREWNRDNPTSRIVISPQQIARRLRDMRASKDERIARTAPKEIRAAVKRELETMQ